MKNRDVVRKSDENGGTADGMYSLFVPERKSYD